MFGPLRRADWLLTLSSDANKSLNCASSDVLLGFVAEESHVSEMDITVVNQSSVIPQQLDEQCQIVQFMFFDHFLANYFT